MRISGSLALFIAFFLCSYYFNLLLACVAFPIFSFLFVFLFPILFFSFCLSLPLFSGIQLLLCGFYCLFLTLCIPITFLNHSLTSFSCSFFLFHSLSYLSPSSFHRATCQMFFGYTYNEMI